jgi:hypothetical protein
MDIVYVAAIGDRGENANETSLENRSIDSKTIVNTIITAYHITVPQQDKYP